LGCGNNQLTSLDVSKNFALTSLSCGDNQLTSLDVSSNRFTYLDCSNNQLTTLKLQQKINIFRVVDKLHCINLDILHCSGNKFDCEALKRKYGIRN
jgi:Leucine-rich repeat (LRR) protein